MNLSTVDLSNNLLRTIPKEFFNLSKIETINLANNRIIDTTDFILYNKAQNL